LFEAGLEHIKTALLPPIQQQNNISLLMSALQNTSTLLCVRGTFLLELNLTGILKQETRHSLDSSNGKIIVRFTIVLRVMSLMFIYFFNKVLRCSSI